MAEPSSIVGRMYRRVANATSPVPKTETPADREKRALKVLGGMKVHGTHVKQIDLGDKILDVPTVAYVKLLEAQIKEVRNQHRELQNQHNKLVRQYDRLVNELRNIKDELNNKVNLR